MAALTSTVFLLVADAVVVLSSGQESLDAFNRPGKGLIIRPEQSQISIPLPRAVASRMDDSL